MKLIILSLLLLSLTGVKPNANLYPWASFDIVGKWQAKWTSTEYSYENNQVPDVELDYGNGTSELIELKWYSPVEGYEKECNFIGHMKRDPSYNAVVNGCPDEAYFRILVDTPLEAYVNVTRNTLVSESRSNSDLVMDTEDEMEDLDSLDINEKDLLRDLEQSRKLGNLEGTKFDPNQTFKHQIPPELYFRIGLAVEYGVIRFFNEDRVKTYKVLAQFISHIQFIYHMRSLGTKITFDTPVPIIEFPEWDCNYAKFTVCNPLFNSLLKEKYNDTWVKHGNLQHLLGLQNSKGGLLGLSALGATCNSRKARSISRLMMGKKNKDGVISLTPRILAHELTHNVGFGHVNATICGEGHFMGGGGYTRGWSPCHLVKMKVNYEQGFAKGGGYCMDRENPATTGGSSWEPWSGYSRCKKCKQFRTRVCIGMNACPGEDFEERVCKRKPCLKKFNLL